VKIKKCQEVMNMTQQHERKDCLSYETLLDYVEGGLSVTEKAATEKHLIRCAWCREELALYTRVARSEVSAAEQAQLKQLGLDQIAEQAVRLRRVVDVREAVQSGPWWRRAVFTPLRVAAGVAALVVISALIWFLLIRQTAIEEGMMALRQAYHQARPTEARITGFDYAPYQVTRGVGQRMDEIRLELARAKLVRAFMEEGTPEAHHALGQYYLTQRQFGEALTHLQKALAEDPDDPQLHTDLGVAYLEQGQALSKAIAHFNQALKKDPTMLEALFNRALCYQKMSDFRSAKADWQHYLELDAVSPWATEARDHLKWIEEREKPSSK
jgi:tetratricopeptide (TPR) repeat protein